MGDLFSINIEGTEKNYNSNLEQYKLTDCCRENINGLFNKNNKIGCFYDSSHSSDLEILWHSFCYKHRLIINKIRFESFQNKKYNKHHIKYEIGFNALWHIQNNEKIPIQCFKKEKNHQITSLSIYIALKTLKQRRIDFVNYINTNYCFSEHSNIINNDIMNILCSYLPSNHIFNYQQRRTFKLCKFMPQQNDKYNVNNYDDDKMMMEINNLVQNKQDFMKLFERNTIKLLMFEYDVNRHEILQFIKYLLFFFYHKYVNKWIKSKCNLHSKQSKIMNNALNEVNLIWTASLQQKSSPKNKTMNHIRVK